MKVQAREERWTLPRFATVRNLRFVMNRGWGKMAVTRSLKMFERADSARVELKWLNGTERQLLLNRWRKES